MSALQETSFAPAPLLGLRPVSYDDVIQVYLAKAQATRSVQNANNTPQAEYRTALRSNERTNVIPDGVRANWVEYQRADLSDALKRRLMMLANLSYGWRGPGSRPMSAASLRTFLAAWRRIPDVAKDPFMNIGPNGNIFLEWHSSWKRHLDIECRTDGVLMFGLLNPPTLLEGSAPVEEAMNTLLGAAPNAFEWTSR
jgi:hypothetical protein